MSQYVLLIDEDEPVTVANKSTGIRLTPGEAEFVLRKAIRRVWALKKEEPNGSDVG